MEPSTSVSLGAKWWNDLAIKDNPANVSHLNLWRKEEFSRQYGHGDAMRQVLQIIMLSFSKLKGLSIINSPEGESTIPLRSLLPIFESNSLESLSINEGLNDSSVTEHEKEELVEAAKLNSSLTLVFACCGNNLYRTDSVVGDFLQILSHLPRLEILHVDGFKGRSLVGISSHFLAPLASCTNLKLLHLQNCFDETACQDIATIIRSNNNRVHSLKIEGAPLTANFMGPIVDAIKVNKDLISLIMAWEEEECPPEVSDMLIDMGKTNRSLALITMFYWRGELQLANEFAYFLTRNWFLRDVNDSTRFRRDYRLVEALGSNMDLPWEKEPLDDTQKFSIQYELARHDPGLFLTLLKRVKWEILSQDVERAAATVAVGNENATLPTLEHKNNSQGSQRKRQTPSSDDPNDGEKRPRCN